MAEMSLTTQERLAITREVYPPKIVELLDITASGGGTKVNYIYHLANTV